MAGTRRAPRWQAPTDEDEADGDDIGEHVAADGLTVPPIALPEEAYKRVELVLAETLWGETSWGQWASPRTWNGSAVVALAPVTARAELVSCLHRWQQHPHSRAAHGRKAPQC